MAGKYHDLFAQHLQVVSQTSVSLMAVCPFHAETDGSLSVQTEKGLWYCFGCHAGGNYEKFVRDMEVEALPVPPADLTTVAHRLRRLADEIDAPPPTLEPHHTVWSTPSAWALWHQQRGVEEKTAAALQLGYDPLISALTIPVRDDVESRWWVVRRMLGKDAKPKYRYPKGYPRNRVFVGNGWATRKMRDPAVLVEGPIDAVATYEALRGARCSVLALGGSSLGDGQLDALRVVQAPVVLCMDGDDPGRSAGRKLGRQLRAEGLKVKTVLLPPNRDPGEMDRAELRALVMAQLGRPGSG